MNALVDWFRETFKDSTPEEPTPFDVMHMAIPGEYPNAEIIRAELWYSKSFPGEPYIKLTFLLEPDNPKSDQRSALVISRYNYCLLLDRLGIDRTNDYTVLVGQRLPTKVTEEHAFSSIMPRMEVLPESKQKSRSTRARTPSRRKK